MCKETKALSYQVAGWVTYGAITFEIGIFHDDRGCRSRTVATGELTSTRRRLFVLGRRSRHAGVRVDWFDALPLCGKILAGRV